MPAAIQKIIRRRKLWIEGLLWNCGLDHERRHRLLHVLLWQRRKKLLPMNFEWGLNKPNKLNFTTLILNMRFKGVFSNYNLKKNFVSFFFMWTTIWLIRFSAICSLQQAVKSKNQEAPSELKIELQINPSLSVAVKRLRLKHSIELTYISIYYTLLGKARSEVKDSVVARRQRPIVTQNRIVICIQE